MSCPNLALDHGTTAAPDRPDASTGSPGDASDPNVVEQAAAPDPASEALAAIASTYEDARAGIISGDSSPATEEPAEGPSHDLAPPGHSPTVPLTLVTSLTRAEPPQEPTSDEAQAATFWSRLVRRVSSGPRGRHSATESDGLPAETFQWGPPGRVRYRPHQPHRLVR